MVKIKVRREGRYCVARAIFQDHKHDPLILVKAKTPQEVADYLSDRHPYIRVEWDWKSVAPVTLFTPLEICLVTGAGVLLGIIVYVIFG